MDFKEGVWRFFRRSGVYDQVGSKGKQINLKQIAPNINIFLWRPILSDPQLCTLKELQDGTYNINDLMDMHEGLNLLRKVKDNGNN